MTTSPKLTFPNLVFVLCLDKVEIARMAITETKVATAASIGLRLLSYFFLRWVSFNLLRGEMRRGEQKY